MAAHLRGVIHRDVKPQNIIVTPAEQIKVLDFGLAKFVLQNQSGELPANGQSETAQLGFVVGTIAYMSPEQTRGEQLDSRSDIFSFGIVLYQMLSGHNPFLRETRKETLAAINGETPPPPPDEPAGLANIALKCLEKEPDSRYQNSAQLQEAFRDLRAERDKAIARQKQISSRRQLLKLYTVVALVVLIVCVAISTFVYLKRSQTHSLAILPITNQSGDAAKNYLSEGLTRNLFDKFSYLPRLQVKTPTVAPSSQRGEILRMGRELNVEAILYGEVLKQGESLRLHLTMVQTADGSTAWEQTSDLDGTDMFALQDDITSKVSGRLGLWLIGDEKNLLTKHQTNNPDALRLYMRGRVYLNAKRDRRNVQLAVECFQQAVDLDPAFAKAYTGLADAYSIMSTVNYGSMPTREAMDRARWNAERALETDQTLAEAHTSMGVIKFRYAWDWQQAELEFRKAIEINPEYAPAHYQYSNLLVVLHRFDEAISESKRAWELDPQSPYSAMNYGRALYYARRSRRPERDE